MTTAHINNCLNWMGFWKRPLGRQQQPTAMEQAYKEGYDAYNRGLCDEDCPHKAALLRKIWFDGYFDAIGDRHW